jgi:hypothetical protein
MSPRDVRPTPSDLCIACRERPAPEGLQCHTCQSTPRVPATNVRAAIRRLEEPRAPAPRARTTTRRGARSLPAAPGADPDRLEHAEQQEGIELLERLGWRAWRTGQRNATGTQDPGIADVYALHPRHGALWWEAKRPVGGVQSADQIEFQTHCRIAGVPYACGALPQLRALLASIHNQET